MRAFLALLQGLVSGTLIAVGAMLVLYWTAWLLFH